MKSLFPASIIFVTFIVGCAATPIDDVGTESANIYGMSPFAPSGGYPLGSIIVLNEDGLPELSTEVVVLHDVVGKKKTVSDPERFPPGFFQQTNQFRANLKAALKHGDISASTESELSKVASFGIEIRDAERQFLDVGRAGLISWLYEFNLQEEKDYLALKGIYDTHEGQQKYLISEVMKVFDGTYVAEWDSKLGTGAKGEFLDLIKWQSHTTTTVGGKQLFEITPRKDSLVAYKRYALPMNKIKNALDRRSWE